MAELASSRMTPTGPFRSSRYPGTCTPIYAYFRLFAAIYGYIRLRVFTPIYAQHKPPPFFFRRTPSHHHGKIVWYNTLIIMQTGYLHCPDIFFGRTEHYPWRNIFSHDYDLYLYDLYLYVNPIKTIWNLISKAAVMSAQGGKSMTIMGILASLIFLDVTMRT